MRCIKYWHIIKFEERVFVGCINSIQNKSVDESGKAYK